MGHRNISQYHHLEKETEQHQSVDGLLTLFTKANHDLTTVQNKLEKEFQQVYPDNVNPMKLVSRIKKVQDEMSTLKEQCCELLAAKQDLIDKAGGTLVGNRTLLQRFQLSTGVPMISDSDDPSYSSFNQVIDEWTTQVRSRTEDESPESGENISQMLFSAIVHGN